MRLALRCVLRNWAARQGAAGSSTGEAAAAAEPDRFDEVLSLQHHWERLQDGTKLEYAQMGALAHRLLATCSAQAAETLTPRDMAQLLARFGANSHTIRCAAAGARVACTCSGRAARAAGMHSDRHQALLPLLMSRPHGRPLCCDSIGFHLAMASAAATAHAPQGMLLTPAACRSDAELRPLAVGIFPLGAMVNHDCRPNTVHTFSGARMVFRCGPGVWVRPWHR